MKKKKVRFDNIKPGEYFKYYRIVYFKVTLCTAYRIIRKAAPERFFYYDDMVIPVTVTIKVKEK